MGLLSRRLDGCGYIIQRKVSRDKGQMDFIDGFELCKCQMILFFAIFDNTMKNRV